MTHKTIALDAMGGDYGVETTVPAALAILKERQDIDIILVGDQPTLQNQLNFYGAQHKTRIQLVHSTQVVQMDDLPRQALRKKKDSSMRVAINCVKDGAAQACVSAGNTGALMAIARFVLKTVSGIERPAIITMLPTVDKYCHMLDLGANIDCTVNHLYQFAIMGALLASAVCNISRPTVGLLNIGEEEIKGTLQVKKAAQLLAESKFVNYIGFVEGDDIYKGTADVIVCDGFVGNIALKTSEGLAKMLAEQLKKEFKRSLWSKIIALLAKPTMHRVAKHLDPRNYNGASLIGLRNIVIKSHGSADALAFTHAIKVAAQEIDTNVPAMIEYNLSHTFTSTEQT